MNQDPNVQVENMFVGYFTRVPATDENDHEIPHTFWATCNLCDPANARRYKWRRGTGDGLGTLVKHLRTKHPAVFHPPEVVQYEPTEAPPAV